MRDVAFTARTVFSRSNLAKTNSIPAKARLARPVGAVIGDSLLSDAIGYMHITSSRRELYLCNTLVTTRGKL